MMTARERIEHEIDKLELRLNILRNRVKTMPPGGGLEYFDDDLCKLLKETGDEVTDYTRGLNDAMREAG